MSGVTAVRYVVESAQERRRQEQLAQWRRYAQQRAELDALRDEARGYRSVLGDDVVDVPRAARVRATADPARIAAAAERTAELVQRYRGLLAESVAVAARRDALGAIPAVREAPAQPEVRRATATGVRVDTVAAAGTAATGDVAAAREVREKREQQRRRDDELLRHRERIRRELAERAAVELAKLPAHASEATRSACRAAVTELAGTPSEARARLLLTDLTATVAREIETDRLVRASRVELEALATTLDTVPTGDAAGLRREIATLVESRARHVPRELPARVTALVEAVERARRRQIVATAVRMSLTDLQYEVTDGFETVLALHGSALANLPGRPGYGVKFLLDAGQDTVRTQVVRSAQVPKDTGADAAAEQRFCDQYPDLLARLRRHGVHTAEAAVRPPGAGAVGEVAHGAVPAADTRNHYTSTEQSMGWPS